jgi:hypothetical protein
MAHELSPGIVSDLAARSLGVFRGRAAVKLGLNTQRIDRVARGRRDRAGPPRHVPHERRDAVARAVLTRGSALGRTGIGCPGVLCRGTDATTASTSSSRTTRHPREERSTVARRRHRLRARQRKMERARLPRLASSSQRGRRSPATPTGYSPNSPPPSPPDRTPARRGVAAYVASDV